MFGCSKHLWMIFDSGIEKKMGKLKVRIRKWVSGTGGKIIRKWESITNWNIDVTCHHGGCIVLVRIQSLSTLGLYRNTYATGQDCWGPLWRLGPSGDKMRQLSLILNITEINWTVLQQKVILPASWSIFTPSWCPHWNEARGEVTTVILGCWNRPISQTTFKWCSMRYPTLLVNLPSSNLHLSIKRYQPTRVINIINRHLIMT